MESQATKVNQSPVLQQMAPIARLKSPGFWLKVLLVAVLALLAAPQLWYPFGFDQGVYAACGDVIRRGGIPIQDCFETKQPGVMVMYAIPMFFTMAPMAIHAFTLLWTALTAVVIGLTAGRLFGRSAAWPAGVLYWLAYAGINYWSMDQAETFANFFLVIALLGAWLGSQTSNVRPDHTSTASVLPSPLWLVLAGACIGVAFWFKYVFGLIGIALALCILVQVWLRNRSLPRAMGSSVLFGFTTLGVVALGVLYFVLHGALGALVSQFQFLLAAFPLGPPRTVPQIFMQMLRFFDNGADITSDFKATVPQWIILGGGFPLIGLLAVAGIVHWARREPMRYVFVLMYFLSAAAVVVWQANYIQYQYTIMLPAFAIAAAGLYGFPTAQPPALPQPGAHPTRSRFQNPQSVLLVGTLILAGMLLSIRLLPWVDDAYQNVVLRGKSALSIYLESFVAPNIPLAEYIDRHTQPTDTLFIFGDAPWVYTLADRRNATRFSFVNLWLRKRDAVTYPLFTRQLLEGLQRNQPVYFILTKPNFPWPNNDYIPDFKAATAIYQYVESHYAYEGENGPFLLFHRK